MTKEKREYKGKQTATFTIQSVCRVITRKEKRGADATFERELLKSWSNYPGWKSAGKALDALPHA